MGGNMIFFNRFLPKTTPKETANFFDYPAKKQKKLIERAAAKASEMQLAVIKEYDNKFKD